MRNIRTSLLLALAGGLVVGILALRPAQAAPAPPVKEPKRGPNRTAEQAAKWLKDNRDTFRLAIQFATVADAPPGIILATDRKSIGADVPQVYEISMDEATALVHVLVDSGLWTRPDTVPPGPLVPGRYLWLGPGPSGGGNWRLGDVGDDVSSMYIVREVLKRSDDKRKEALMRWLRHGVAMPER